MRKILILLFCCVSNLLHSQSVDDFVFDVEILDTGFGVHDYGFSVVANSNLTIDWGDGSSSSFTGPTDGFVTHTYSVTGFYTIRIIGALESFRLSSRGRIDVVQWGNASFTTMNRAFTDAIEVTVSASDIPDMSNVTDFSEMFANTDFNSDVSAWDMSSALNLERMFSGSQTFNMPVQSWDVSNVTNMRRLFSYASSFNQAIGTWDVSNVEDMNSMFNNASVFNQNISSWDVSNVTDMSYMFGGTNDFDQPLNTWNVSNVTRFSYMFSGAGAFNQPLDNWNMSSAQRLDAMFYGTEVFNQPLNSWDISNVFTLKDIFGSSDLFNQPLYSWDTSNVSEMSGAFLLSQSFNQNLEQWVFNDNVTLSNFVSYSQLDSNNYDALLRRFLGLKLRNSSLFSAITLTYCDQFSRQLLINNGFSISGDNLATNCANNISGKIVFDLNNDGCDASDNGADNFPVKVFNASTGVTLYPNKGEYVARLGYGNYTVTPMFDTSLYQLSPPNFTFQIMSDADQFIQDFCVSASGIKEDIEIIVLPLEQARPGFDTDYKVVVKNKGNQTVSGSVTLDFEEDFMTLLSSNPNAGNMPSNQLSWSFNSLQPFQMEEYAFTMTMNTPTQTTNPLNGGDILTFTGTVTGSGTDVMPADNIMVLDQTVVNSYDPNDKTCLEGKVIEPLQVGEYVHYMIRFENTGTASAINVVIKDEIDLTQFDITSLIPLEGSHDYYTRVRDNNVVEFIHEDINLDFNDATNDGYVLFKIKTLNTLIEGDTFDNTAEIYFDFNFPIITNTETVTIMSTASIGETTDTSISVYPNPAKDFINISSINTLKSAAVIDVNGRILSQTNFTGNNTEQHISLENLTSGVYFFTIQSEVGQKVEKVIVE